MPAMDYGRIAALYDTYVNTSFDLGFFLKEARRASGEVLELMAGTGRVSIPLIEAGIPLTCVDSSPEMLAVLQQKLEKKGLSAYVHEMDVCELSLGKQFDLIFIPFHSFGELISATEQRDALSRIHEHLSETGRFICTLHNPRIRLRTEDGRLRLVGSYPLNGGQGTLILWSAGNYDARDHLVSGLQLFEEYDTDGFLKLRRSLELRFCPLRKTEFEELAVSTGFKASALYGDYAYSEFLEDKSPFMIWVLHKK